MSSTTRPLTDSEFIQQALNLKTISRSNFIWLFRNNPLDLPATKKIATHAGNAKRANC